VTDKQDWQPYLDELARRTALAEAMGSERKIALQRERGRLTARDRIASLCDQNSFNEYGALAGGNHPGGAEPLAGDGLVGGTARIDGRSVVVIAEDFTVKGGSIGHVNTAKRTRLVRLALEEQIPLVLMLDGAGERADNQRERYPNAPGDLQLIADLKGVVPMVTLVLGTSAGHGALTGVFSHFVIILEGAAMFTAGPPLVQAALGIAPTIEELGGAKLHAAQSGVAHNVYATEIECFAAATKFLSLVSGQTASKTTLIGDEAAAKRKLDRALDIVPARTNQPYDMLELLGHIVDDGSFLELQPHYGRNVVTGLARIGGIGCMLIANQPAVQAGAITVNAADKATHFIEVADAFDLPLVFFLDNPGVMPGPAAEKSGVLKAAGRMFLAQRRYRGRKVSVTLRKAFGFGSSVMGMNPWDGQAVTLALPSVSLGGVPAAGGADAAHSDEQAAVELQALQSGAWVPADNMAFDKVIDPRDLRNEIMDVLTR